MSRYMDHTHPQAFQDLPRLEPYLPWGCIHECPTCKGHGYWNLRINSYPRYENPADRHFKQMCGTCHGYGYTKNPNPCEHDWSDRITIGKCLHQVTCSKCGTKMQVDSSD